VEGLRKFWFFVLIICNLQAMDFPFSADNRAVLVTGGAGYIGSHTCKALKDVGFTPVVYDSLVLGKKEFVKWGPLVVGDLLDVDALDKVFSEYKPCAVIHFAGLRDVKQSMECPDSYYANNVIGSLNLLNAMLKAQVEHIIFSSSSCVYGEHRDDLISENHRKEPVNPYGMSKLMVERMIEDYAMAYPLKYVILRYFNAAGVDVEAGLTRPECSLGFLIPHVLQSRFQTDSSLQVFGSEYPTRDGTAIRDYIHVKDLANGHILSLQHLLQGGQSDVFNLGTGKGCSVLEVLKTIEEVTGEKVSYEIKPRRPGDLAQAVAEVEKAKRILNFSPHFSDLHTIIESEWIALQSKEAERDCDAIP
jgi:UDP-arabinose 4-epimerase